MRSLFRWIVAFLTLMLPMAVSARTWYVSDCAGAGHTSGCYLDANIANCDPDASGHVGDVISNPLCPDPAGDSSFPYLAYLFDGTNTVTNPDVSPGDTVILCSGDCSGSAPATYSPHMVSGQSYWLCPKAGGALTQPVYVRNNPGTIVTITGNTDGSTLAGKPTVTAGDITNFIDDKCRSSADPTDIRWIGSDVSGNKGIRFAYSVDRMFWFSTGDRLGGGPTGWWWEGVQIDHVGSETWGDGDYYTNCYREPCNPAGATCCDDNGQNCYGCCGSSPQHNVFYIGGLDRDLSLGDAWTFKNNLVYQACGTLFRTINNGQSTHAHAEVIGNVIHNIGWVDASFNAWNISDNTKYIQWTYEGNTWWDTAGGVGIKGNTRGYIVQDNTMYCTGTSNISDTFGSCGSATFMQGSTGNSFYMSDHVIRRNKVYDLAPGGYGFQGPLGTDGQCQCSTTNCSPSGNGCTGPGCEHTAACVGNGAVVEDNFVWSRYARNPNSKEGAAIGFHSRPLQEVVQNNTIVGGNGGIWEDTSSPTTPIIKNNLVYGVDSNAAGGLLHLRSGIDMSQVQSNNLATPIGDCIVKIENTCYGCAAVNAGQVPGLPTSNKCSTPSIARCGTSPGCATLDTTTPVNWNLHLTSSDSADKDCGIPMSGCPGTDVAPLCLDIDKEDRNGQNVPPTDIGADEYIPPELLADGGFELGLWTLTDYDPCGDCTNCSGESQTDTTYVRSGTQSASTRFTRAGLSTVCSGSISTTVSGLTIGMVHRLTGYILQSGMDEALWANPAIISISNSSVPPGCTFQAGAEGTWQPFSCVMTASATSTTISLSMGTILPASGTVKVYYDDLSFR